MNKPKKSDGKTSSFRDNSTIRTDRLDPNQFMNHKKTDTIVLIQNTSICAPAKDLYYTP